MGQISLFGTIQIGGKGKLSVNENCQLSNNKNVYIIDEVYLILKEINIL